MFAGELGITDGSTYIDLLSEHGFHMTEWTPQRSALKGGGVWRDSPMLDGRQLVYFRWGNITDLFRIEVTQMAMASLIHECQEADRLLLKALAYWQAEWATEPVYLVARSPLESNKRYALVHGYALPHDADPYSPPFLAQFVHSGMTDMELSIEHGPWLANVPGTAANVNISTDLDVWSPITTGGPSAYYITVNTDNGEIYNWQDFDNDKGGNTLGISGLLSDSKTYGVFARYQNILIAAGHHCVWAYLHVKWHNSLDTTGPFVNVRARMENVDDAITVPNSYQTFMEKSLIDVFCPLRYAHETDNIRPFGPVTRIVNAILDRPGWGSGQDMQLYLLPTYAGADLAVIDNRTAHAQNFGLYHAISATQINVGRTETALQECYITNHCAWHKALRFCYRYDTSLASFSINLAGRTTFELFPNPIGVGDMVYFAVGLGEGTSPLAGQQGILYNVVFDLGTVIAAGDPAQFEWEYWSGAAWAELAVYDQTALIYGLNEDYSWRHSGVCSLAFSPPGDWDHLVINPPIVQDLYWIRCRLTANVPANIPAQQNRYVYPESEPFVTIAADQIEGDLPALGRIVFRQESHRADKVIMALRSMSRGNDYSPYLNFDWIGNPEGIKCEARDIGADKYLETEKVESPRGALCKVDLDSISEPDDVYLSIPRPMSLQYTGVFRAFLRLKCSAAEETFKVQAYGETYYHYRDITRQFWASEATYVNTTEWALVDLGKVVIPLTEEGAFDEIIFRFSFKRTGGNPLWLYLQDFILMPMDEWAGEFNAPTETAGLYGDGAERVSLVVDSIGNPKSTVEATTIDEDGVAITGWEAIVNGPVQFQCRSEQRLFFLTAYYDDVWISEPYPIASVKVEKMERYRGMRGNR